MNEYLYEKIHTWKNSSERAKERSGSWSSMLKERKMMSYVCLEKDNESVLPDRNDGPVLGWYLKAGILWEQNAQFHP